MIEHNTCLFLGAGASDPFGFRTGRKLLFDISSYLRDENHPVTDILHSLDFEYQDLKEFAQSLVLSAQPSVDAFLENRPRYVDLGKAAIAAALIPCERKERLERQPGELSLYEYLFNQMGARLADFSSNKLSVITFNYDRSLEYLLLTALMHSYGIDEEEAAEVLRSIPVVHVYGQVGKAHFAGADGRDYSPEVTQQIVSKCMTEIHIFHEATPDTDEFRRAHELIGQAGTLCFLGFGYHPVNVQRLNVNSLFKARSRLFGSCYGMKWAERVSAMHLFKPPLYGRDPRGNFGEEDMDALTFLRSYRVFV